MYERRNVTINWEENGVRFDQSKITSFKPFSYGSAVFGGHFGDEGKGKMVDQMAKHYKTKGLKLLSVRGQGGGNAGHTVIVDGVKYDFHYLTSAGLLADIMLLGPGMLIDPIRILEESKKLPKGNQLTIMIAERAAIVTDLDRAMDSWCENQRTSSGQAAIGTTKSGMGPAAGNRGYRFHMTFADALLCKNAEEFRHKFLVNPILPEEVIKVFTQDYANELWNAIHKLNIVDSCQVISECRKSGGWAVLLEVSQAVGLDNFFGNGGHFVTSSQCTDIAGAAGSGLTLYDFPDGSTMVLKAYASKVGGGKFMTKFERSELPISDFIDGIVGERGVTTGRKRDLGWFDGPAVRHAISLTGADICINCMDVIAELPRVTDHVKICFAYKNVFTNEITYNWPYCPDNFIPLYVSMYFNGNDKDEIIKNYILTIEKIIGKKITSYGIGPTREDFKKRDEAFR